MWFWVIVLVLIIGAVAVVASGRGESMADVYDDRPDTAIPVGRPLTADDIRNVRLTTGLRGYRMDEVDALLSRVEADLLARAESEDAALRHDDISATDDKEPAEHTDDPAPAQDVEDADEAEERRTP